MTRGLAEEVTQSVFLVAWTRLREFRYEHEASFVAWLFAIARRVVAERSRKERQAALVGLQLADHVVVGFEDAIVDRASVIDGLLRLPEGQREVLVLRFLVGLSIAEVALSLGKSEGRVKELQHRGLGRLRTLEVRGIST